MGSVSIVIPYDDRWYFAEVLRGAIGHIEAAGHTAQVRVIPPAADSTRHAAEAIERDFADADNLGGIVTGFKYQADQASRVATWNRPLVVVGGSAMGLPTVMIDDIGAAMTATSHLLGLGHTRITHLAGELHDQMDFSVNGRRAKGYRTAMGSAGLDPAIVETEFDDEDAYRAARTLLDSPARPTAVFAVSDEVAFAALAAARDLGLRVGSDISIVGIDDHPRAEAEDLTTVHQSPFDLGATAADLLLNGLAHSPDAKQSRLQPISLIKRGSTARLRSE